jgi:predicted unusual protein kinase regulating ubiquinone biosynthesis (AarF/ABC1/UbiB family)
MGFFLPDADLERIEEAQSAVLNRIWGRSLLEMSRPDISEVRELSVEFRDILREFPFQVPQDFIYLGRALGMISGLTSQLNPQIDPWQQLERFALDILRDERLSLFSISRLLEELQALFAFPARARRLLEAAERGELQIQTAPNPTTARRLERLERRVGRLNSGLLVGALLVSGTILYVNGFEVVGWVFWGAAGLGWLITALR